MIYNNRRIRQSSIYLILLGILLITAWFFRGPIKDWWEARGEADIPAAVNKTEVVQDDIFDNIGPTNVNKESEPEPAPEPGPIPDQFNLAMTFTPQAPHANWNLPYQEACEEASAAMVHYYWSEQEFANPEEADAELLRLVDFQNNTYGEYEDTNAEETAQFMRDFYGYENIEVIDNPTVEQIKEEVAAGFPVMVPAYGKVLENPNFRSGGPLYHMLVIKGYTVGTFITNDPGTRRGADFVYNIDNIMSSMGDWNDGDPQNGSKVVIVVRGT
jgi:hypothetical protein